MPKHIEHEGTFPLLRDPALVPALVQSIERDLGESFHVDGILEIGSYAKKESVPESDSDLRIFVSSPSVAIRQLSGSRFSMQKEASEAERIKREKVFEKLPIREIDWFLFNDPMADAISKELGVNVEFGFQDRRMAEYELSHLDTEPTVEHQLFLQSGIIYDPSGWIKGWLDRMNGVVYAPLVPYYSDRYLNALPFEVYTHLDVHQFDALKAKKSGQIQWVKWAIRAIRDAIWSKMYTLYGENIYQKSDILSFVQQYFPDDFVSIRELYEWKVNADIRKKMLRDFLEHPEKYFSLFREKTEFLEGFVERVLLLKMKE